MNEIFENVFHYHISRKDRAMSLKSEPYSRWIKRQTKRNDAIGDFARDWRADKFPYPVVCGYYGRGRTLREHLDYLTRSGACSAALRACAAAWREYENFVA
jgi:hypothetical protein